MNDFMASSPSEKISTTSPEFISETAYKIIFSVGLLVVFLTIFVAAYYCRSDDLPTSNLNGQRVSPIATANLWTQSRDDQPPMACKQGLDEALLSTYPKVTYSQVKLQYGNLNSSCCSICLADYNDDDMLLLLPDCTHFFHVKCAFQWLQLHPTCPMCRKLASPISSPVPQLEDHVV